MTRADILTNHRSSPHLGTNDRLANPLSITLPRLFEWLSRGFGYHVEARERSGARPGAVRAEPAPIATRPVSERDVRTRFDG